MLKKGSVVLYKNHYALITECGEKYTIAFTGGSQKVREKDIALLHIGALATLSQIEQAPTKQLSQLHIQLDEAWELLQGEDATSFSLADIAELSLGEFVAEKAWLLYSSIVLHPRFVPLPLQNPEPPMFTLRTEEETQTIMAKEAEKGRGTELRAAFIGRLKQKKLELPADGIFMTEVESFALGKTATSKVMKEAGFSCTPEKAHKLLLDTNIWKVSRNPHPSRWGLSMQSASEHLCQPPTEDRITVEHTAYAIDNSWSSDPDDAIAFDGTYVWVHIADPASTVFPDSPIDISARGRGSTLYLPEGASRMLAEDSLTDYALGLAEELDPTQLSRALSFRLKLDNSGAIEDSAVVKTFVKVERLTYKQADEQKNSSALAPLYTIAKKNIERRKAAGAVFIELPEVHLHVSKTDENVLVSIDSIVQTESSAVVREFMLLAGEAAARFAFKNNIAFPYVSQDTPDIPKDLPEGLAGQHRTRRSMKRRSVGITPGHHAGLGITMYSQVTSPLRRYSDLIAHQQLRAFLDGRPLLDNDKMLERISAGDAAASATVKAERKSNLHWTLVYLLQHPDWHAEAIVADIKDKQAIILIPSIGQESIISAPRTLTLNEKISVHACNINIPELRVAYELDI